MMTRSSLALLGVTFGCVAEQQPGAVDMPVVALGSTPLLSIGEEDGNPAELLAGAFTALLLEDGSIVIANSAAHDIRVFDSTGQHLRTAGRSGSGPGEFRSYLVAYFDSDGAVAVYDHGAQRVTTYDTDWRPRISTFTGSEAGGPSPGPTWLLGKFWIHGVVKAQRRNEVRRTLDLSGLNSFHGVLSGTARCIWTAPDGPYARDWTVRSPGGQPIRRVVLPENAQLLQVVKDRVLLRRVDSLGVVRIVVYLLEAPQECRQAPATQQSTALDVTPQVRHEAPDVFVRDLFIAQEVHYANHARYAAAAAALQLPPSAPPIVILLGDEQGYLAVAVAGDYICGVGVGYPTPAFWLEAIPYCS